MTPFDPSERRHKYVRSQSQRGTSVVQDMTPAFPQYDPTAPTISMAPPDSEVDLDVDMLISALDQEGGSFGGGSSAWGGANSLGGSGGLDFNAWSGEDTAEDAQSASRGRPLSPREQGKRVRQRT